MTTNYLDEIQDNGSTHENDKKHLIFEPNYTQIPNVIFDYWMQKLSVTEFHILLFLCRKTFGWHKVRDRISLSQIEKGTNLGKTSVIKSIKSLIVHNLVEKISRKTESGDADINIYEIKIINGSARSEQGVVREVNKGVVREVNTQKKDQTKENLQKKTTTTSSFPVKEPPDPKPESVVLSGCAGSAVADVKKDFDISFEVNMCDGTKKTVDTSEVYRHFSSKRFENSGIETWMIQEGLDQMKKSGGQYRNVMQYLEHICKAKITNKVKSSPKKTDQSENKLSREEQRALLEERRRINRKMWEEAEKEGL